MVAAARVALKLLFQDPNIALWMLAFLPPGFEKQKRSVLLQSVLAYVLHHTLSTTSLLIVTYTQSYLQRSAPMCT